MSDATRQQVIEWARNNMCNFIDAVYPPPEGWSWAECEGTKALILTSIFTNTLDEDVTSVDVTGGYCSSKIN